ncbi:hypothetical protein [Caballeronia zhejiangensis]|uniref:hypothetical protein n=1 Tax=Caballeronia zhejiangensis TaxID=871203 RepID=UPI0011868917|nr:hypothetical protein [Caballeronia zhejiangensis]
MKGSAMRRHSLLIAAAALAACSTSPVPLSSAKPVSADRRISTMFTTPSDSGQKNTVIRNAGAYAGSFSSLVLSVDGKETAKLSPGEALPLYLPEGQHLLTATFKISALAPVSLLAVTPSRFPIVRFDMDSGGARLQPATE